jgi:hypothetical protein
MPVSDMDKRDIESIQDAIQRATGKWRTPESDFEVASKYLRTHPGNTTRHAKGGKVGHIANKGYKRLR